MSLEKTHLQVKRFRLGMGVNTMRVAALAAGLCGGLLAGSQHGAYAHGADGHPARIHEGTCEALGPVAYQLNGVGAQVDLDEAPLATPTVINPETSVPVMVSTTTIEGSLDDLMASDLALMIYESDEEMEAIACGNLGGARFGDELVTGLRETGTSGNVGFALFQSKGEQTQVTLLLGPAMPSGTSDGAAEAHNGDDQVEGGDDAVATPSA